MNQGCGAGTQISGFGSSSRHSLFWHQHQRRSQGRPGGHGLPKFLAYVVILFFERRYPKQNSAIRLKSNILATTNFFAPQKILGWLRHCLALDPAPEWFGPLETENHCIICTTRFPHKLGLLNRNTDISSSSSPNSFWLRLQLWPSKIAWAPAPGSGSTALVWTTAPELNQRFKVSELDYWMFNYRVSKV